MKVLEVDLNLIIFLLYLLRVRLKNFVFAPAIGRGFRDACLYSPEVSRNLFGVASEFSQSNKSDLFAEIQRQRVENALTNGQT